MQIRCQQCHKPFGIAKEAVHQALDVCFSDNLHHFDFHCPHCRRLNHVSKAELQRAAPDWKKAENESAA